MKLIEDIPYFVCLKCGYKTHSSFALSEHIRTKEMKN